MDIKQLQEEIRSQIGTIALLDRTRAEHVQQIALLERTVSRMETQMSELHGRVRELEAGANHELGTKQRLARAVRMIATRIESL